MAVDADPRNSIAVVGLARVAIERGDEARAYEMGLRALEIDHDNQAAQRLVDRLLEVRAVRGEGPPRIGREAHVAPAIVGDVPPATRATNGHKPEPAKQPAEAMVKVEPPKAAEAPPAAKAQPPAKPTEAAAVAVAAPPKPAEAPPKGIEVAAPAKSPETLSKPAVDRAPAANVEPSRVDVGAPPRPVKPAITTTPPAEKPPARETPKPVPETARDVPEAPAASGRAAGSAAVRKPKVVQPATIRTSGGRRTSPAPPLAPPKTALPKAKPLLPPEAAPSVSASDEPAGERPRAPRPGTRPARSMRSVEPKQPGLFDRLFRPKR
jgi:hypothetical protein